MRPNLNFIVIADRCFPTDLIGCEDISRVELVGDCYFFLMLLWGCA